MVAPLIAAAGGVVIGGARIAAMGGVALARGGAALLRGGAAATARGASALGRGATSAAKYGIERMMTRGAGGGGVIDTEAMLQEWLEDILIDEVNKQARQIFTDARENTPKGETGRLKQGWRVKFITQVAENAEVWNVEDYAAYVEYDTRHTRGRYMLTNAISRARL